jgi:hypothetical protein
MENQESGGSPFSDRHDVVRTVLVWRNKGCYRIEIIQRCAKPEEHAFAALLWTEEEHGGRRVLVRDITFPWVHRETAEAALDWALDHLATRLQPAASAENEF